MGQTKLINHEIFEVDTRSTVYPEDGAEIIFNLLNDFIGTSELNRMPHGAVDMDEISPLQSTQEAVPGTRTCKYQVVLF